MARPMTDEETEAFLTGGTKTGKVAWVARNGSPHVAPIWFLLDGSDIVFMTATDSGKGRALARTGRASLVVDMEEPPYAFVKIDGSVSLTKDAPDLLDWATRIGGRYMGEEKAEEFGRRNAGSGEALVRLTPERLTAVTGLSD